MALGNVINNGGPSKIITSQVQFIGPEVKSGTELNIGEDLVLAGEAGTAGQVLTSQGEGNVPVWADAAGGEWGDITGTLSDQTDLQDALDAKLNVLDPVVENSLSVEPTSGTGSVVASIGGGPTTNTLIVTMGDAATAPATAIVAQNSTNSTAGSTIIGMRRSKGTEDTPLAVTNGNLLGTLNFAGHNGVTWAGGVNITAFANENWSETANGTTVQVAVRPQGSTASQTAMRISSTAVNDAQVLFPATNTTGITATGALNISSSAGSIAFSAGIGSMSIDNGGVLVGSSGYFTPPAATLATLPAVIGTGQILFVSDANSAVGTLCFSNGSDWIDIKTGVAVA